MVLKECLVEVVVVDRNSRQRAWERAVLSLCLS